MLGILWMAAGLATLGYGEQFPMFRIPSEQYPQAAHYLAYLTAFMAIIQGYWFSKQKGLVPYLGLTLFAVLAIRISLSATLDVDHAITRADWGALFVIILMIMSLFGCVRRKR
jgi:uncharacterized protein